MLKPRRDRQLILGQASSTPVNSAPPPAPTTWGKRRTGSPAGVLDAGTTFQGVRVIEVLRAKQVLAALPEVAPSRIGLLGHSGACMTNNFVVHVDPGLAALVTDLATTYSGSNDVNGVTKLLEEHVPALVPLAKRVAQSPVPTLKVPYGFGNVSDITTFLDQALMLSTSNESVE